MGTWLSVRLSENQRNRMFVSDSLGLPQARSWVIAGVEWWALSLRGI